MATTVYSVENIELQNGAPVVLKPLNIKKLRLFNEKMKDFNRAPDQEPLSEDEALDVLIDLCAICLSGQVDTGDRDALEEALDIDTIYKVIEVCGGIKLNDPNLIAMAQAITE